MKKIVIIDDSEANLFLVKSLFDEDKDRYNVIIESESKNALTILRKEMPDLLILDLMMPGINGFELLDIIKNDPELKNIPVLIVSAMEEAKAKDKVLSLGALYYIPKPIDLNEVKNKVNFLLDL